MTIAYNDDVLTEILLRLPAKSVIRFKLVCRRLRFLISSQHFSHLHAVRHRYSKREPSLLLCLKERFEFFYLQNSLYGAKLVKYHFPRTLIDPTVLGFSNGLFLLRCRNVENAPKECHIYNPTTKASRRILLNDNNRCRTVMGLNLAFDPLKSPHYKIICVRAGGRRSSLWLSQLRRCLIEVYESETNTWKLCGEPFLAPNDINFDRGVYWNDGIHWRGIFFDFRRSVVCEHPRISAPGNATVVTYDHNYVESNGHLHYIAHFEDLDSLCVFELESDYSCWSLKYHIDLARHFGPLSVLSFVRGESEEESVIVVHRPGKILGYRFHGKRFKELVDFREEVFYEEGCIQFVSSRTFGFVETLAPLSCDFE